MNFSWFKFLVLIAVAGFALNYYKVPALVFKQMQALGFKSSGFESDAPQRAPKVEKARGIATSIHNVTRVVDGDTIQIDSGEKVRYIGINTPETVDPRTSVQCFGKEASAFNKQLVEGRDVKLVVDVSETDKYGRLLRYVYLNDGTFVNLELVKKGYARVDTFPPDVAHAKEFVAADHAARLAKLGLWSACK